MIYHFLAIVLLATLTAVTSAKAWINPFPNQPTPVSQITGDALIFCKNMPEPVEMEIKKNPGPSAIYKLHMRVNGAILDIPILEKNFIGELSTGLVRLKNNSGTEHVTIGNLNKSTPEISQYCQNNPTQFYATEVDFKTTYKLTYFFQANRIYCKHEGSTVPFFDPGYYVQIVDANTVFTTNEGKVNIPTQYRPSGTYETKAECEQDK